MKYSSCAKRGTRVVKVLVSIKNWKFHEASRYFPATLCVSPLPSPPPNSAQRALLSARLSSGLAPAAQQPLEDLRQLCQKVSATNCAQVLVQVDDQTSRSMLWKASEAPSMVQCF